MSATFNALTGTELIEVIKEEIGNKLDLTGEFKGHSTFPWVRVSYEIKVLGYPQQDIKDEPKIKVSGDLEIPKPRIGESPSLAHAEAPTIAYLKDEKVIDTPDKARVEAKLPVPVVAPAPGNVLVDRFVQKPPVKK